jgi:hypothetical protein
MVAPRLRKVHCGRVAVIVSLALSMSAQAHSTVDGRPIGHSGVAFANIVSQGATGGAWAWGDDTEGQLGNTGAQDQLAPVPVAGPGGTGYLSGVVAVSSGRHEHAGAARGRERLALGMGVRRDTSSGACALGRFWFPVRNRGSRARRRAQLGTGVRQNRVGLGRWFSRATRRWHEERQGAAGARQGSCWQRVPY